MSLKELFLNAKALEAFEDKAVEAGFRNFSRRNGEFYCHSDLNQFAAGFLSAIKMIAKLTSSTPEQADFAVDATRFKVEAQ